ncbi:MAG: DUF1697 domain-containing protein [Gemmatimonadetes bacterium]|nr:DUF1697 domain-containing protein [Gemmatimonadota bacterium]
MARVVAFLRAINVGGHIVPMARLKALFEAQGLAGVETFIASGNVIFESRATRLDRLEATLAAHLEAELGYGVAVFLRTGAELAAIASHPAFPPGEVRGAYAVHVAFLGAPPSRAAARTVAGFTTAEDAFHVRGREVYWLCRIRTSDSAFSNVRFEKVLGMPATFRNRNTLDRIVAKYGFAAAPGRRPG